MPMRKDEVANYPKLIEASVLSEEIDRLSKVIAEDYKKQAITLIPILTGGMRFAADILARLHRETDARVCAVKAESYGHKQIAGPIRVLDGLLQEDDIRGRQVLLVDDIWDTGQTLAAIQQRVAECSPENITSAALLSKPVCHRKEYHFDISYVGFEIPNVFVVGYGMDHEGRMRQLDDIRIADHDARSRIHELREQVKQIGRIQLPPHHRAGVK
jgi:hypoxanthine phosphoribosyltransferase